MTYKARRTRDLQGEVKAGTGISVTESVNPDGTKVYTLENTAPGGGNEFEEVKIIDSDNNVKMLLDTDGVHIYNEDGNEVATLTKEEIVLRDDENGYDKVYLSRNGQIYCNNSDGNETLSIDYDNGNIYIRNALGNDKFIIEEDGNLATLRLCDEDGNEVLSGISLIDMQNSLWVFDIRLIDLDTNNKFYIGIGDDINREVVVPNNVRDNDYYEIVDTQSMLADVNLFGIKCNYSGIYKIIISTYQSCNSSNGRLDQTFRIFNANGQFEDIKTRYDIGEIDGGDDYGGTIVSENIFNIEEGGIIAPYWGDGTYYISANNQIDNSGIRTRITIQKIR